MNLYSYVGNNPLIRNDPSGNNWVTKAWHTVKDVGKSTFENIVFKKAEQRSIWWAAAESGIRGEYGYQLTADLLEHSLQDHPGSLVYGNDSYAASLIKSDQSFNEALKGNVFNTDAFKNGTTLNASFSSAFDSGDLEAAIHNYNMKVTGTKKSDGTWVLNFTMTDKYDYTELVLPGDGSGRYTGNPKIWIPNDFAYLSQKSGAIVTYQLIINFTMTIKP